MRNIDSSEINSLVMAIDTLLGLIENVDDDDLVNYYDENIGPLQSLLEKVRGEAIRQDEAKVRRWAKAILKKKIKSVK